MQRFTAALGNLVNRQTLLFLTWLTRHLSTEFCEHRLSSFCVILLTNKQTSTDENTTFLLEVTPGLFQSQSASTRCHHCHHYTLSLLRPIYPDSLDLFQPLSSRKQNNSIYQKLLLHAINGIRRMQPVLVYLPYLFTSSLSPSLPPPFPSFFLSLFLCALNILDSRQKLQHGVYHNTCSRISSHLQTAHVLWPPVELCWISEHPQSTVPTRSE